MSHLAITAIVLSQAINGLVFPPPIGPYHTSLTTHQLIDATRIDALSPTNQTRRLMISLFHPVAAGSCTPTAVPYMDRASAAYQDDQFSVYGLPPGTFPSLELHGCAPARRPRVAHPKPPAFPVVVFSPGLGTSRLLYSALAQHVASAGYTVVTVDHPYDVDIVVFPDGSSVTAVDLPDALIPRAVEARVADISFVLDQLAGAGVARAVAPGLEVSKVGVFGHSLGGAAAAEAMRGDPRLVGGVDLDGTFFGPVVEEGLGFPFLIFGHEGKDTTADPSWAAIWPRLTGFKRVLMLRGARHYAFSDLANVVDVLGIRGLLPEVVGGLLGNIEGKRVSEVVLEYVVGFFDMVLKDGRGQMFDGASVSFPEVSFESP
ncbi:PAF acetylhydrolase family protein [Amylocarpus encephaloides]|uniref:1-alkyl-2-acetylglycerophosphocholine esterase n=1 Tax=Amylocarpus encephaloides TaxID=45428 RepID=A0A9P7YPR4_9HELO|nr:PAF acetylhydrolase family protein [Amylocarpus encephaloides]